MPRRAKPAPYVDEWIATLSASCATQYAPCVRAFFGKRANHDVRSIGRSELVEYCASIDSSLQPKVCTALDSYFTFLDDQDLIDKHPAPQLAKKASGLRKRYAFEQQLRNAGITDDEIEALRWRDVARDVATPASGLPSTIDTTTRDGLIDALLDRLRRASAKSVMAILDVPLFD